MGISTNGYQKLAYALIVSFAVADCVTTYIALQLPGLYEKSPFVAPLYATQDFKNILLFQLVMVPSMWYVIYLLISKLDKVSEFLKLRWNVPIGTISFIASFSVFYLPVLFENARLILISF